MLVNGKNGKKKLQYYAMAADQTRPAVCRERTPLGSDDRRMRWGGKGGAPSSGRLLLCCSGWRCRHARLLADGKGRVISAAGGVGGRLGLGPPHGLVGSRVLSVARRLLARRAVARRRLVEGLNATRVTLRRQPL